MADNGSNKTGLRDALSHSEDPIHEEYETVRALYNAQTNLVQRFLESQARQLSEAILRNQLEARFSLPDQVALDPRSSKMVPVPAEFRDQMIGGIIDRLTRVDTRTVLRQRLAELEESPDVAVSKAAALLRYSIANFLVYSLLPSGRTVTYTAAEGEVVPTIPVRSDEFGSAITEATDAIVEDNRRPDRERGELQVPFVPAARFFFLPQWVAFDDDGNLLVNSVNEAEAHLASMQRFVSILHMAVGLAVYMVADPEYQAKRYGMLGQLIHQGRALARYETQEMIRVIQRRAATQDLNRGLSLSLPFFDDQDLQMRTRDFEVIPGGRIMFSPAFVVRAVHAEQAKVAQDTRLSPSTCKYLLAELAAFEQAFSVPMTHQ